MENIYRGDESKKEEKELWVHFQVISSGEGKRK